MRAGVTTLGVVGAGAMGAGIAQIALAAGLNVVLYDLIAENLDKAAKDIFGRLSRMVDKGQLPEGGAAKERLTLATSLVEFAPADVVIEAIVERLESKQQLFKSLEAVVSKATVLATNTSSLSVAAIAAGCADKTRVCGLHFFNPVPLMKLVEVIVAPFTSEAVAKIATELSSALGKTPVRVKDGPGFLVNLAGRAYVTEALHVVQEGVADVATVDRIMRDGAGFRMGPFELMDLTGIDVNFPATAHIYQGYQHDPRLRTTTLHELMFNAGRFGRKTGHGYHDCAAGVEAQKSEPPLSARGSAFCARLPEPAAGLEQLVAAGRLTVGDGPNLIAPIGEDACTACDRLGLDPAKTVAIDFTASSNRHLTLMTAPGGSAVAASVADWLGGHGLRVEVVRDSPGFVLQRILCMVANLGCELAQIGVGSPADIDLAMKLAQNYPLGPLEWADRLGPATVHAVLRKLQDITGSDRYRPSLWLRRRALLDLPIHQVD
jgi:3-hydroxybutyryl-CoA dehydrogenase